MFWGQIYVSKFDGKQFLSMTWAEQNILKALNALKKHCFCRKKIRCATNYIMKLKTVNAVINCV